MIVRRALDELGVYAIELFCVLNVTSESAGAAASR